MKSQDRSGRTSRGGVIASSSARSAGHIRQPRVAEMVADVLRRRIIGGGAAGDAVLPKIEDLLKEFGVGKPAMREALRILETEGLITVRRGNVGGALVHSPQSVDAAYTLALVLESRAVALSDVGAALLEVEPLCASLCARRPDRHSAVLPALIEVHERATAARTDPPELTRLARQFHEVLVERCGNETMILVVGALESLWSAHEQDWAEATPPPEEFAGPERGRASLSTHARIIKLIDAGSAEAVARLVREHLAASAFYARSSASNARVRNDSGRRRPARGW
jgi:DNA-binding FadR family transcriptional regulator